MKSGVNDVTGSMELLVSRVSAMSWVTVVQMDNKGRDDDTQFERLKRDSTRNPFFCIVMDCMFVLHPPYSCVEIRMPSVIDSWRVGQSGDSWLQVHDGKT